MGQNRYIFSYGSQLKSIPPLSHLIGVQLHEFFFTCLYGKPYRAPNWYKCCIDES